jgi:hypothetical protein
MRCVELKRARILTPRYSHVIWRSALRRSVDRSESITARLTGTSATACGSRRCRQYNLASASLDHRTGSIDDSILGAEGFEETDRCIHAFASPVRCNDAALSAGNRPCADRRTRLSIVHRHAQRLGPSWHRPRESDACENDRGQRSRSSTRPRSSTSRRRAEPLRDRRALAGCRLRPAP